MGAIALVSDSKGKVFKPPISSEDDPKTVFIAQNVTFGVAIHQKSNGAISSSLATYIVRRLVTSLTYPN